MHTAQCPHYTRRWACAAAAAAVRVDKQRGGGGEQVEKFQQQYLFLIIKYTVLGKCWLGTFPYFSECIPKKRVSRRRTSVLGGTRNCTEKWPSQQVPRKGIFYDQNYIFSHADRVFFGSIWTNSNIRSLRVPLFYSSNPNLHKQSWWLRMLRR